MTDTLADGDAEGDEAHVVAAAGGGLVTIGVMLMAMCELISWVE